MNAERRQRVLEILDATLAEPPGSRPDYLAKACGDDVTLREEVESLLELEDEADDFLPGPAVPLPGEEPTLEDLRISHYRVVELLGRGGMGAVYRAVREDDFEKQVAIKLLQRDLVNEATVRRFHNERQILARLEHPAIARLLDGGTTDDGRPYLVMEYVDGVPIDRYCDEHELDVGARLRLFEQVCSALAFAHQSLVIHRDLKPGNILITEDGAPKLLDFGIAKLIEPDDTVHPDLTRASEQPMTPRYASPEQVRRLPITTASDVYGLGSLLYRLLTGRLPCGLESCRFGEIPWRIVEEEPVKPSVAVTRVEEVRTTEGETRWTPESVARTREGDPDRLRRRLAGDVDAIVMKALRKEPQSRYGSVDQMVEDLRRHFTGQPVAARRGTLLYRGSKFARRHRWGLVAALAVLVVLAGFLVRERQRLEDEKQRAERVTEVLRGLLNIADPDRREDVVQPLEDAREQLALLEAEPALRSDLLATLGRIHRKLGDVDRAGELMAESLELWRQHNPADYSGLAARVNNLGMIQLDRGDYTAAESRFREAITLREQLGEETEELVANLYNLATVLLYRGAYAEAEQIYRRGLDFRTRTLGPDDPGVARSLVGLGALLYAKGDLEAAESMLREALAIRVAAHGDDHTSVAALLELLGRVHLASGDAWEAGRLHQRALEIRRGLLGESHTSVTSSERHLAAVALAAGELDTAAILLSRVYASVKQGNPAGDWRIADVESLLGELLTAEGRFDEAEACLVAGHRVLDAERGPHAVYTREARGRLAALYETWGRPEKAAPYQSSRSEP